MEPYTTGFAFEDIYENDFVLSSNEIIKNCIAQKTSSRFSYLGEFTIDNLPTLYFAITCENCQTDFLIVFSVGEKQPGLEILQISGAWEYLIAKYN
jgi:hypothetical protein